MTKTEEQEQTSPYMNYSGLQFCRKVQQERLGADGAFGSQIISLKASPSRACSSASRNLIGYA